MQRPKRMIRQPQQRPTARQPLERELRRLQDNMLIMGSRVSHNILGAVDILKNQDVDGAMQLIADDRLVNAQRYQMEADCLSLIATQNPIARDLRTVAAVLAIVTELERINDYAKGIAKVTRMIGKEPLLSPTPNLPRMAVKAQGMLRRALFAFTERDVALAYTIATLDDEVDALYNQIYADLMAEVMQSPQLATHANYHLWAAHNLERTGDRALNICERVIFTVTGKLVELDNLAPNDDVAR
ncbi:MAG TPA: phosphate signaling complex protein PhoU [Chloroflexota bacterium]|nr:phosphate signaling complex protein PhoU [Chloroflexota bacterium]